MPNGSTQKKLDDYSRDELIVLVKDLRKRKKFGLVWEAKPENVVEQCKRELPVLEEVESRAITEAPDGATSLLRSSPRKRARLYERCTTACR
jgi:adenine-specific DNA-methyltransferase